MNRFLLSLIFLGSLSMGWAQPPVYSDHYYERVAQFKEEPPIARKEIVMVGNSLTENGGNWAVRLHKRHVRNRGIIGDEAQGIYDRLAEITVAKPRKIVLMVGVNDLSHDLGADSIVSLVGTIVERIRTDSPRTRIYVQSLLPINETFGRYSKLIGKTEEIPVINQKLEKLVKGRKKIRFVNLFSLFTEPGSSVLRPELSTDGLHLNETGYAIWEKALKKAL